MSGNIGEHEQPAATWRGWCVLMGVCVMLSLLWLVIFPTLSGRDSFRHHAAQRESAGVELSAMFYTDLPVLEKPTVITRLSEDDPWALWWPWRQTELPAEKPVAD